MKSLALLSAALCLPGLLACSSVPDSVGESTSAVSGPSDVTGTPGQLDQHFTTGVGNPAELQLWPSGSPAVAACTGAELAITYVDDTGYFTGASRIHAWVRTTQGSGSGAITRTGVQHLTAQSGTGASEYFLPLCLSTETLTLVEIAFSNDAETKWDSNDSRNYNLEFPAAPPAPACFAAMPFTAPHWKAPTPLHQNACTTTEIAAYEVCAGGASCTSGSRSCDSCLQTDESDGAYGPLITGGALGAFVNWGGCQANLDGATERGSCGNQTNDWQTCAAAECPAACGGDAEACMASAFVSACIGNTESASCANEWNGTVSECATFTSLVTLWCGP
jgi:hypothetical protein